MRKWRSHQTSLDLRLSPTNPPQIVCHPFSQEVRLHLAGQAHTQLPPRPSCAAARRQDHLRQDRRLAHRNSSRVCMQLMDRLARWLYGNTLTPLPGLLRPRNQYERPSRDSRLLLHFLDLRAVPNLRLRRLETARFHNLVVLPRQVKVLVMLFSCRPFWLYPIAETTEETERPQTGRGRTFYFIHARRAATQPL